jgi:hypothetical protein
VASRDPTKYCHGSHGSGLADFAMVGEVAKVVVDHRPSLFYVLQYYSYVCKIIGVLGFG